CKAQSAPIRLQSARYIAAAILCSIAQTIFGQSANDLITQSKVFKEPLTWVGAKPPAEAESGALWEACRLVPISKEPAVAGFEQFIREYPDSPWVPSLRANLAYYYRTIGRYTPALQHWQAAWEATRGFTSDPGKRVADFTLGNWSQLLASLGRVDELKTL